MIQLRTWLFPDAISTHVLADARPNVPDISGIDLNDFPAIAK